VKAPIAAGEAFHTHQVVPTFQISMARYTHPKKAARRMPCRSIHNKGTKAKKIKKVNGETGHAANKSNPLAADKRKRDKFFKIGQCVYCRL